jgi:hypothetical protein
MRDRARYSYRGRVARRVVGLLGPLLAALALAPTPALAAGYTAPPDPVIYTVIALVYVGIIAGIAAAANTLGASSQATATSAPWRLSDALSEEGDVTDASGVKRTIMVASSSRLIALFGMIVIMALFLGVGTVVLWSFAKTGTVEKLDGILQYFLAGAGLFIPYSINQIRAGFGSIGKQ